MEGSERKLMPPSDHVAHLAEELFFQLVRPAPVSVVVSCQVTYVCTLDHHLYTIQYLMP